MCVFLSTVPTLPVPKLAIACVGFNLSLVKKAWPALPASVRHRPSDNDVLMKKWSLPNNRLIAGVRVRPGPEGADCGRHAPHGGEGGRPRLHHQD